MNERGNSIKVIGSEGVPDIFHSSNCIYLLGSREKIADKVAPIKDILVRNNINFDIKILNPVGANNLSDYLEGNIVIPLFDIDNRVRGYVIGDDNDFSLEDTILPAAKMALESQRKYLEDLLMAAAFNNPVEFNKSIDLAFGEKPDSSETPQSTNLSKKLLGLLPLLIFQIPFNPLSGDYIGINGGGGLDLDGDGAEDLEPPSSGENIEFSGIWVDQRRFLNTSDMSNKNKREFLKHIPEKISERYIRKNPNCKKDLEALIASVSHEDLQQLFLKLVTRQKGATHIFDFSNLSAASEYEVHVRKWDKTIKGFDHKFHYCMFLKDSSGQEYPLKFQHHPAYCLYMMYVIDRAKRGNDASYLSIRDNKDQFIRLYQTVFGDPYHEAERKYLTFSYRLTKEGAITRKGRYDDYLKDIDTTITSIVGKADSIPLKLRDGGHLELLPEKIKIDENLKIFNFK